MIATNPEINGMMLLGLGLTVLLQAFAEKNI